MGTIKNIEDFFANNLKILHYDLDLLICFAAAILSEKVIRMRYFDLQFSDTVSVMDNRK